MSIDISLATERVNRISHRRVPIFRMYRNTKNTEERGYSAHSIRATFIPTALDMRRASRTCNATWATPTQGGVVLVLWPGPCLAGFVEAVPDLDEHEIEM